MKRQLEYLGLVKRTLLLSFIAFVCLPLIQMTVISFTATLPTPTTDVGAFTLSNYAGIWSNPSLRSAFLNSIAYVLINIAITIPVAIPAAYAFSRMSFNGDKHLFLAFIAFRITPPVVLTSPISIWILQGFISAIPKEMDETAFLDGYSRPRFI